MTKINKMRLLMLMVVIVCFCFSSFAHAWLIYHKPEFRGRVIDAETKQPIEGAVVVVIYDKTPLVGCPGGPNSYVTAAKETLTDLKGEFFFPSYNEFILFTKDSGVSFIFFKPGYKSDYGTTNLDPRLIEDYFATDVVGKEGELHASSGRPASYKGPLGIIKLKKAMTRDEKLRAMPSFPTDYTSKELPILIKMMNAEYNNLGIKGGYR